MIVDLHCHIVPGIDDGARDMDTALEMCRIAAADGTDVIIATPHYIYGSIDNTKELIHQRVAELNMHLKEKEIDIEIYPGCEAFICPELPQLVKEGQVCTLNDTNYILMEFPMDSIPEYAVDVIYKLKLEGYTPIIAHPERNMVISQNPDRLFDLINRGALAQVNATSLKGLFGKSIKASAIQLLRSNMIHFLASDAHTTGGRSPRITEAAEIIEREAGKEVMQTILRNSEAVLKGQLIHIEDPIEVKSARKASFFGSIKKKVSSMF